MSQEQKTKASDAILARAEYLGIEGAQGDKLFAMAGKFEEQARKLPGGKLLFGAIDNAEGMIPQEIRDGVAQTAKEKLNETTPEEGSFVKTVIDKGSEGIKFVTDLISRVAQAIGEKLFDTKSQQAGKALSTQLSSDDTAMKGLDAIAKDSGISAQNLRDTVLTSVAQDDARDVIDSVDLVQQHAKHVALQMVNKAMGKEAEAFDDTSKITNLQSNRIFNNVFKMAYDERVTAGDSSEAALLKANEVAESVTGMNLVKEDGADVLKPSEKYVGLREALKESFIAVKEDKASNNAVASVNFSAENADAKKLASEATKAVKDNVIQDASYDKPNGADSVAAANTPATDEQKSRGVTS
jgi:hypothetical protein